MDNALHSPWIRLRSEWSQWLKNLDLCALITTSFPPEIAPSVARSVKSSSTDNAVFKYHQERLAANGLRMQLEASVDEVVAAPFARDVIAWAKLSHFQVQTFRAPEGCERTRRKLIWTFLACKARSRLQTPCLRTTCASASRCARKRWGALMECLCLFTSSRGSKIEEGGARGAYFFFEQEAHSRFRRRQQDPHEGV